ncbi:MAG: EamA family transporter [Acidobacteria bacterium]|nr:EamA family transporter [Acidobacteriota bacterium]
MSPSERQHRFRVILAFALVYVLWGSTYLGIRIAVDDIPPATLAGVRFLIAGIVMLAVCAVTGRKIALTRRDFMRVGSVGVLLLTGGNVLVCWAEQYVASGLAALIVASVPIWVVVIEALILRHERLSGRGLFGLGLGIAGLLVLLWPRLQTGTLGGRMELIGALALVLASLSWASGSVSSRRWKLEVDVFVSTAWQMVIAGAVDLALGFALGETERIRWTLKGIGATAYLVVAGSWVGHTAYIWLLHHVPTQKVATYAYVNPVVAVFLGWLVLGERVDAYILAGATVILAAVALVNTSRIVKPALAAPATRPAQPEPAPALSGCEPLAD